MSDRKGEEMTLPISTPIEVGMVTTRAQQLTLAQHEEEALTLESDVPEIHTLDPCYKGNQTEESEGKDEETAIPRIQPEPELEKGKSVQPLNDGAILALQLSKISLIDHAARSKVLSPAHNTHSRRTFWSRADPSNDTATDGLAGVGKGHGGTVQFLSDLP